MKLITAAQLVAMAHAKGIALTESEADAVLAAIEKPQPSAEEQLRILIKAMPKIPKAFLPLKQPHHERANPNQPFYARFRKDKRRR